MMKSLVIVVFVLCCLPLISAELQRQKRQFVPGTLLRHLHESTRGEPGNEIKPNKTRVKRQIDDPDLPGLPDFENPRVKKMKDSRETISLMRMKNVNEDNSSGVPVGIPGLQNMLQTVPFGDFIYQIAMKILYQLMKPTLFLNDLIQKVSNLLAVL